MPDGLIESARHRLAMKGLCRFDVPRSAQFDWMQAQCVRWTGGRLKMLAARTAVAQVRILPVGDERVIVWDHEHLGQLEYLWFLLQFDNDSDLELLAQYALHRFAALVLLAEGTDYVVHAGQLIRGVQKAVPNKAEIERHQRGRHIYDAEPITVAGYLLFFHEEAHYVFRSPSASRDRYFRMASDRIEALLQKAERGIKEGDLRSVHGPRSPLLSESEAAGVYPRNIIAFMGQRQHEASFVEEVACDLFAVEQLLKSYRTDSRPETIGRLYTNVMMHYQLQATLEGLRRVYKRSIIPATLQTLRSTRKTRFETIFGGSTLSSKSLTC